MIAVFMRLPTLGINDGIHFWESLLINAVRRNNMEFFTALLRRPDVKVNMVDSRTRSTALMWAVKLHRLEMLLLLLGHPDTRVDDYDSAGDSPMVRAVSQGFLQGALALLQVTTAMIDLEVRHHCPRVPLRRVRAQVLCR
jgi:hypothetical protein